MFANFIISVSSCSLSVCNTFIPFFLKFCIWGFIVSFICGSSSSAFAFASLFCTVATSFDAALFCKVASLFCTALPSVRSCGALYSKPK